VPSILPGRRSPLPWRALDCGSGTASRQSPWNPHANSMFHSSIPPERSTIWNQQENVRRQSVTCPETCLEGNCSRTLEPGPPRASGAQWKMIMSYELRASRAAPRDAADWRAVNVVVGATVAMALGFGGLALMSVFMRPLEVEFGWSRSEVSFAYAAGTIGMAAGGVVWGRVSDRVDIRILLAIGGSGIVLSLLAMAAVRSLWHIYLANLALGGFGIVMLVAWAGRLGRHGSRRLRGRRPFRHLPELRSVVRPGRNSGRPESHRDRHVDRPAPEHRTTATKRYRCSGCIVPVCRAKCTAVQTRPIQHLVKATQSFILLEIPDMLDANADAMRRSPADQPRRAEGWL